MLSHPQKVFDVLEYADILRLTATSKLDECKRIALSQFFTPAPIARLMASMFENMSTNAKHVHILDAGSGVGILSVAAITELLQRDRRPDYIQVTVCEIDEALIEFTHQSLARCQQLCEHESVRFSFEVVPGDFIAYGVDLLEESLFSAHERPVFTHAILNPPYHKIASSSKTRKLLHSIGIESTNLYAAFMAIIARLLSPAGELVAITPRSFCNGPYFKSFRQAFLKEMTLRHIHVFESRQHTFEDEVLQENVILHAIKGKGAKDADSVVISSSTMSNDDLILSHKVAYEQVVSPHDAQSFIHIVPDDMGYQVVEKMANFHLSLEDLGLNVSTGRVVDFRAEAFLRQLPDEGTVPLIYPTHLHNGRICWPKQDSRKPNAILDVEQTQTLLVPNEHYVLVKRFSAKEERRRVVAAVYNAEDISATCVGFENHLNYFHEQGKGISLTLAKGLAAFLNSTLVDSYFRQFNGHTQVNATDLRNIHYPTREQLEQLGAKIAEEFPDQTRLDELIEKELFVMSDEQGDSQEQNPIRIKRRIDEALEILKELGLPRAQQNERSALTLLALLDLTPDKSWSQAIDPLCGITPMMEFFALHYRKSYKPNTRETVRRQTVHQFLDAGLVVENPDDSNRPPNSPKAVYQIERGALELLRSYGSHEWEQNLRAYLSSVETLKQRYAQEREMRRIPVQVAQDKILLLSPGGQNVLVEQIINEFAPRFTPAAKVLYVGDTDNKFAYFDEEGLAACRSDNRSTRKNT